MQQPEIIELCFNKCKQGHSKVIFLVKMIAFYLDIYTENWRVFRKYYSILTLSFKESPQQQLAAVTSVQLLVDVAGLGSQDVGLPPRPVPFPNNSCCAQFWKPKAASFSS